MSITTTSNLPAPVQKWFDDVLLSRPMPTLIHKKFAMKKRLPSKNSRTVRYRRYNNLQTATVPLSINGSNPPAQVLSAVDIDATVDWYGTYVAITEMVTLTNQDPVLNESASLLSQSMQESADELARNMLEATCSQVNCTGGVNGDSPTELSRADIDAVVKTLINNNAMMISDNVEGSLKFGTAPVREAFWGMMNSNILDDLEAVNGFISTAQYPSQMNVLDAEWGSVGNTRFLYSSAGSVTPHASMNGADIHNTFIVGKESYACVDLDGQSAEFIYKPLGSAGSADPLNRIQTAGFKFAETPVLLNDAWAINLRATHS